MNSGEILPSATANKFAGQPSGRHHPRDLHCYLGFIDLRQTDKHQSHAIERVITPLGHMTALAWMGAFIVYHGGHLMGFV